jgi:hypothetical protein
MITTMQVSSFIVCPYLGYTTNTEGPLFLRSVAYMGALLSLYWLIPVLFNGAASAVHVI